LAATVTLLELLLLLAGAPSEARRSNKTLGVHSVHATQTRSLNADGSGSPVRVPGGHIDHGKQRVSLFAPSQPPGAANEPSGQVRQD
jgi:hypothetical protein